MVSAGPTRSRRIGKIAALVGVCPGFVGNRMLAQRGREAGALLDEGAMPWDVDRALYEFGFAMGPFQMSDLAGLDIGWVKEQSRGESIRDRLCELDRRGQKTGAGYYDYDANRNGSPSPVTEAIVREFAERSGRQARSFTQEEIVERLIYPMINEGAKILEEGKAIRASDIDIIWINGYNWPAYRGGPMFYADQVGLDQVLARLQELTATAGPQWTPGAAARASGRRGQAALRGAGDDRDRRQVEPPALAQGVLRVGPCPVGGDGLASRPTLNRWGRRFSSEPQRGVRQPVVHRRRPGRGRAVRNLLLTPLGRSSATESAPIWSAPGPVRRRDRLHLENLFADVRCGAARGIVHHRERRTGKASWSFVGFAPAHRAIGRTFRLRCTLAVRFRVTGLEFLSFDTESGGLVGSGCGGARVTDGFRPLNGLCRGRGCVILR